MPVISAAFTRVSLQDAGHYICELGFFTEPEYKTQYTLVVWGVSLASIVLYSTAQIAIYRSRKVNYIHFCKFT